MSTCLHIQEGQIKVSCHKLIVSHTPQGTTCVDLQFGELQFSIFPGERAGELAAAFTSMAADLTALAAELKATKVLALSD